MYPDLCLVFPPLQFGLLDSLRLTHSLQILDVGFIGSPHWHSIFLFFALQLGQSK